MIEDFIYYYHNCKAAPDPKLCVFKTLSWILLNTADSLSICAADVASQKIFGDSKLVLFHSISRQHKNGI